MLLSEPLLGPGFVAVDLLINLFTISSIIAKGRPKLRFGQPVVGSTETYEAAVKTLVGGNDLPDLDTGSGETGSPARGAIGKDDTGTAAHFYGFGQ